MLDKGGIYAAAVVGGGIVGLAVAVALAGAGHRVALIERRRPVRLRGRLGFDVRTVALTPASADFLQELGGIERGALAPIDAMRVWEHDGAGNLDFVPPAASPLAWVVENSLATTGLWRAAEARLACFAPATVTALELATDRAQLTFDVGDPPEARAVAARLIIAADGAASELRALAGVAVRRWRDPMQGTQHAIATVAYANQPHANTAWQRFGATGPVALLPLPEPKAVSVIWSSGEAVHRRLAALDDAAFLAALTAETEGATGGFSAVDRRFSFPVAQTMAADVNPAPRLLLTGDAARTLHPLAGQGVNIGLEDAAAIAAAAKRGGDLGVAGRWRAYASDRRARSKMMIVLLRSLLAAYCGRRASGPWMRVMRNAVVRGINASAAVKAQLVREAMGLGPLGAL